MRTRLALVRKAGLGAFILGHTPSGPSLFVHINGDVAYVHYFPDGDDAKNPRPGFQPQPRASGGHETPVRFVMTDGNLGSGIEMDPNYLVSLEQAYAAAADFFQSDVLPPSISWTEL